MYSSETTMDLRRITTLLSFTSMMGLLLFLSFNFASANVVFNVQHKFAAKNQRTLGALKAHDDRRHGRRLAGIDLPLGGDGSPTGTALFFTKIGVGTPSRDYYVQVDTGSDLMWVNCAGCLRCPTKTDLGVNLRLYDREESSSGTIVGCEQAFCSDLFVSPPSCEVGAMCSYVLSYADGSATEGYIVQDTFQLDQASGNFQTTLMNGSVAFGCGTSLSGELAENDHAVDGIIGFGQAKSSMISQLALAGKVQRSFAHCLDSGGGGIFAIGELAQPNLNSTPILPDQSHYNVLMTSLEVGGSVLQLPKDISGNSGVQVIIDSGTTLAYLEDDLYNTLLEKILAAQPGITVQTLQGQFKCFEFHGDIDGGFPDVTMRFEGSLSLEVRPHEYLFRYNDVWCVGWQSSVVQGSEGQVMNLLGDMVLNNKLVLYDLENQTLGWTEYDCSSSIKVRDKQSGAEYLVGSHKLGSHKHSSVSSMDKGWALTLLLLPVIFGSYRL